MQKKWRGGLIGRLPLNFPYFHRNFHKDQYLVRIVHSEQPSNLKNREMKRLWGDLTLFLSTEDDYSAGGELRTAAEFTGLPIEVNIRNNKKEHDQRRIERELFSAMKL